MRMLSLALTAAAALLMSGSAPAFAQSDTPAPAAPAVTGAADAGSAPAKKKKKAAAPAADAAAATPTEGAAKPADAAAAKGAPGAKPAKAGAKKDAAKPAKSKAGAAAAAPVPDSGAVLQPTTTTVTIKSSAPAAVPVAAEPDSSGSNDDDAPSIAHTPITRAPKGKPLVLAAHITDPSGVFQPVLYLRKRGSGDYIPIKLIASKAIQGDYAVEVDAKLISVDLEYYIECYDNVGNGPARVGTPESPLTIKLDEEKKAVANKGAPEAEKHVGAPPAISHVAVVKAFKGFPVEINSKLVGDTGVSAAKVFFRHSGEHDFHELPMGNIGGDDYTATMPASVVTGDLEYYLEAYDQYGNGPGRSGGPMVPYQVTVVEKPPDVIVTTRAADGTLQQQVVSATPNAPTNQPHMVKVPFSMNPGRWTGYLFMAGFVGSMAFAGGELYAANQSDSLYQHTYQYDGRLDNALHQRAVDDVSRAKILGIAGAAALAVSITLLILFPEHPETEIATGSGGDVVVGRF